MAGRLEAARIRAVSPTVLQSGAYRLFFFSSDRGEPPHVHVTRDRKTAKLWLQPVRLEYNLGFAPNESNKILALVQPVARMSLVCACRIIASASACNR